MPSFFDRIDWFLAYDNAQQSFFRQHPQLFSAITVPGTVATVFRQGTGGFVMALQKPYIIDPRTSIFQSDFDRGRLGTRHVRLAEIHGHRAARIMTTRALRIQDLEDGLLSEMAHSVVEFQRSYATTSGQKLDEYLTLLGESVQQPRPPDLVLPPYFRLDSANGPWHGASVAAAVAAAEHDPSARICPVVCLSENCLRQGDFDTIVESYCREAFEGFFLWVSKLDLYRSSVEDLVDFGELVKRFRNARRPVVNLFGGYFSAMLFHLGLAGVGHGVGYGETRDAFYYRGGPPGARYYMSVFHRFYEHYEAQALLARLGSLAQRCDCPACVEVAREGDAPHVQAGRLDREGLLSHFLYTRRRELDHIVATPLFDLASELQLTYDRLFEKSDDELVRRADHLPRWIEALQSLAG